MIYEAIFSVPIIKKAYKSYKMSFFEKVKFLVRGRVGVGR